MLLSVPLTADERRALERAAEREMRPVRDHARWLIVRALLNQKTALTVETLAGDTVRAAHSEPCGSESAPLEGA